MKYLAIASLLFPVVACSSGGGSSTDPPPASNGVNDVLLACQIRAQWAHGTASACSTCIAEVETPKCPCSDYAQAGVCATQETTMKNEPTCAGVSACVSACAATDCACVDACYANKPACRTAASAADGCIANVCDSSCR